MIKYITDTLVSTDLIQTRLCLDIIYIRGGLLIRIEQLSQK
jgi:hypothetical protein